jgi:hypothetical protein
VREVRVRIVSQRANGTQTVAITTWQSYLKGQGIAETLWA